MKNTKEPITPPSAGNLRKPVVWVFAIMTVLMIPYIGNAPWTLSDFIFSAAVLSLCAVTYELATRNMTYRKHRIVVALGILFFIFLVMGWAASGP